MQKIVRKGRDNWRRMQKDRMESLSYQSFLNRHKVTVEKWEGEDRSSEGTLWCDQSCFWHLKVRHKEEEDALFLFLAWDSAPYFWEGLENLGFSWWAMITDTDKSESKQRHMVLLLTTWKFLWRSPDRVKGNLTMRPNCTITSQADTIKPIDYWLPVVYGPP